MFTGAKIDEESLKANGFQSMAIDNCSMYFSKWFPNGTAKEVTFSIDKGSDDIKMTIFTKDAYMSFPCDNWNLANEALGIFDKICASAAAS